MLNADREVKLMRTQVINSILYLLTSIEKHLIKIGLCVLLSSAFTIGFSQAGTWRDEFDEAKLNDWERILDDNPWSATWETEGGLLITSIQKPNHIQVNASDLLRWKARQFQLPRLTVVSKGIHYGLFEHNVRSELSLFLGKRKLAPNFIEGYVFSPEDIEKLTITAKGVYKFGKTKAQYHERFHVTTNHLKVVFDTGKFRLFTQDILLTEFIDDEMVLIDVVGLIISYRPFGDHSMASINAFSISGQDIPNHNFLDVQLRGTHLASTWGSLKSSE